MKNKSESYPRHQKKLTLSALLVYTANFFCDDTNEHRLSTLTDSVRKFFSKIILLKLEK